MSETAAITVHPDVGHGTIRPEVYGHFAEHLGRCIYEGIWVGVDSETPNRDGIRLDTVGALARIGSPIVRWPGGAFADVYHWEDGVGPHEARPTRRNMWWDDLDTNEFGTYEFLTTCERIGAEPYICLNVGTGTPQEALAWMEYCNFDGSTDYASMRAESGRSEPWGVRWWGVGNENWGCGGRFHATDYAKEYRRYASYLKQIDKGGELVACGHTEGIWNQAVLEELRDELEMVDHLSIHRYVQAGDGAAFTTDEYWRLMGTVGIMEDDVKNAAGAIRAYTRGNRSIGVAIDEWGVWHPQATNPTGLFQPNTLRDALFAASSFHMFHRHADVLSMTNIAQTINVLQCLITTDGPKMALTPTYHVYDMFRPHMGATALVTDVDGPNAGYDQDGEARSTHVVDASASSGPDGVFLSVVNRRPDREIECVVKIAGKSVVGATAAVLTGPAANAENDPGENPVVCPIEAACALSDGTSRQMLAPMSVTTIRLST